MQLEDYVKENYPHVIEEFKRRTTPFYYEPGVLYHPITNGLGCGAGGSREPMMIVYADYLESGESFITLQSQLDSTRKFGIANSEIHTKIKRLDESIQPVGMTIPSGKRLRYMTVNGVRFEIDQAYWRNYSDKTLGGRVTVRSGDARIDKDNYGRRHGAYYQLYSHYGSKWTLKNVKSHDSTGREVYEMKHNVSVREFKTMVFGDPNIKIKCELFGHL